MISKSNLSEYFTKRCENIKASLRNFCETGDHEQIHRLRVEFKKIMALVSLIRDCCSDPVIPRELKTAKIVYRRAGIVRDAYIALQHEHPEEGTSSTGGKEFLELAAKEFCGKIDLHIRVIDDWKETVAGHFENIGNSCAHSYYMKWLSWLSISFAGFEDDELHECRKIIKRLMYLYPVMSRQVKDKLRINTEYFDSLQEEIGKWHDTLIAREHYSASHARDSKQMRKLEKESESRLRSIRLLTENFEEKYK